MKLNSFTFSCYSSKKLKTNSIDLQNTKELFSYKEKEKQYIHYTTQHNIHSK